MCYLVVNCNPFTDLNNYHTNILMECCFNQFIWSRINFTIFKFERLTILDPYMLCNSSTISKCVMVTRFFFPFYGIVAVADEAHTRQARPIQSTSVGYARASSLSVHTQNKWKFNTRISGEIYCTKKMAAL